MSKVDFWVASLVDNRRFAGLKLVRGMEIKIPAPNIQFPAVGWDNRFNRYVETARANGVRLSALKPARSTDIQRVESSLNLRLPSELVEFYQVSDGVDLGFVHMLSLANILEHAGWIRGDVAPEDWAPSIAPDLERRDLIVFAEDGCGNFYSYDVRAVARHRAIYLCHDPVGAQVRYTSLATFIESRLVWAYAAGLHSIEEAPLGKYVDDHPWMAAARQFEREIDPAIVRTIDD